MRHPATWSLALAGVLLASCDLGTSSTDLSAPSETLSSTVDISRELFVFPPEFDFFDDCTGELVPLRGTVRLREQSVSPPLTFHRTFQLIQNGSGIGETSGRLYQFQDSHVFQINFGGFNAEVTEITNAFVVAPGPANNATLQLLLHVALNASGETTAFIEKVTVTCR
jgi:hypothetical protein